jgi:hypothetical protein
VAGPLPWPQFSIPELGLLFSSRPEAEGHFAFESVEILVRSLQSKVAGPDAGRRNREVCAAGDLVADGGDLVTE